HLAGKNTFFFTEINLSGQNTSENKRFTGGEEGKFQGGRKRGRRTLRFIVDCIIHSGIISSGFLLSFRPRRKPQRPTPPPSLEIGFSLFCGMGDLRPWSPELNGYVAEERSSSLSPAPLTIDAANWKSAEAATQLIIAEVQPTNVSEERRKAVVDYVQRLIRNSTGCEVLPFGSVPLKTYLPDGDIDLTAFGGLNMEESLANDVQSILEMEDQNSAAEFVVKDVQLIRAEVKLVKCLVQNIVVDISFNQLGGLCTLCFLEEVDRLIGKDHLFKRSIILIKAWCYYESRILGAHHGLISTYALETLVLYIYHLFHSSLDGPLAVLYKFLDYFSKFDWENYCISLNGPVRISSLPEVVVDVADNGGCDLLLSHEFIKQCVDRFSVPFRGSETNPRMFPPKHLNIIDPLKENNNLGRSVSKGNFYRIKSAFSYGARKLGLILSQREENVAAELRGFFSNTLDRHGNGQRPDVQDPVPMDGHHGYSARSAFSLTETGQNGQRNSEPEYPEASGINGQCRWDHERTSDGIKLSDTEEKCSKNTTGAGKLENGSLFSHHRLYGDAKDLASSRIQHLSISNNGPRYSGTKIESPTQPVQQLQAPHLNFSHSVRVNEDVTSGIPLSIEFDSSNFTEKRTPPDILHSAVKETPSAASSGLVENHFTGDHVILSPIGSSAAFPSKDLQPGHFGCQPVVSSTGNFEALDSLSDLSGDYEAHLNSLSHGRWCYEYVPTCPITPISPMMFSPFQNKNYGDGMRRPTHYRQTTNGVSPRPVLSSINPPFLHGAMFGMEEVSKQRGTGTYFPNVVY
ncbi:Protein HESO1, partial [Linum perenne]